MEESPKKGPRDHQEAVQGLFLKHAGVLQGFITGLVPDLALAEDVYQETFLTASRLAEDFKLGTNFLSWARSIAVLKVHEGFRSRKAGIRPLDPKVIELLASAEVETSEMWTRRRDSLADCLRKLPPRARQLVELRYAATPLSPAEIGRKLSWSSHSVDVGLSRARRWLQDCTRRALSAGAL
jgi:RNA polymerase sigma-70 factor (ECF subfamily)